MHGIVNHLKSARLRRYIRDPDGYIIEVGQSTGLTSSVTSGIVTAFPLDGGTRDGVETVGPVCAAG